MEGQTLSHFRILSKLGQGGMGVVYKAEDVNLGRTVAIKVLPAELVGDPKRRARFVTEARTAAAVTHPNIATIYEIDEADGTTFIAMEYLEGETLRQRLGSQPLPLKQAVQIGAEIAAGLAAAHGAKVVHRDLKPDNVMLTRDGHVKILDFGLARLLEAPSPSEGSGPEMTIAATQAVTDPDQVIGTPAYMSPEQARGLAVDFRTDIFSFGCTFYEIITGHRPFRGATSTDTLSDILNKDPVPATTLNPELPSSVGWILEKCLEKEADERYQDTRDLVVDMNHLQRECQALATSARTMPTPQPPGGTAATPSPYSTSATPPPAAAPESAGLGQATPQPSLASHPSMASPPYQTSSGVTQTIEMSARRRWIGLGVAVVVTAAAVLGATRLFDRQAAIEHTAEANSLAIFAFENRADAEDPQRYGQIFQDVLITALSGLEPLKVYSGQRLFDIQKQLSSGSTNVFDKEIATEVARRAGAEHMLTGSLGQLGEKWILTCQMVQVDNGTVVFSKRIDGEDLYQVADVLTSELKSDLQIAAPSEVSQEIPVRQKTSSSLDAYRTYLEGCDLLNTNKYREAAEKFREALAIDPDFGRAQFKLAAAVSWPGDQPDLAKKLYDEFLERELYTSDKEKRLAETARARLDGHYAEILPKQQQLVRDYPDEKDAWYELGETLFHYPGGGKMEGALDAFERAVTLDPDFLLPYQHIFDTYWEERRYDEARARAETLIARDGTNPFWHRFKAATLAFTTEESELDAMMSDALQHQPTPEDRRELYRLVASKLWARAPSKQEEYLKKALAADPDHDDPSIVRALMGQLQNRARHDEFEAWVHGELEKDPDNSFLQDQLLDVYAATRRYAEALAYARQIARQKPNDTQWTREWLAFAVGNGEDAEAEIALEAAFRAAKSKDDSLFLYTRLGWAYAGRGDYNRAVEFDQQGLALQENPYPFLYNNLGWRQLARGRHDEAQAAFERVLELSPTFEGAHFGLVQTAAARGDEKAVTQAVDRLIEALPPGPFGMLADGRKHLLAGRLQKARQSFEEFLSQPAPDWRRYQSLNQVGDNYLDSGYIEEALEVFQRAAQLEIARRLPQAQNQIGLCYLLTADYAAGERALREALQVEYPNRITRTRLATAQILQRKFDDAEKTLRDELEYRPHRFIDELLVLVRMGQKRYDEARVLAEGCVAADSSRVSHALLAWTLVAGEIDVERGVREAEVALGVPGDADNHPHQLPCFPPAEHSLGRAALLRGDPQAALAHLRRAAERMPKRESLQADLRRAEAMATGTP